MASENLIVELTLLGIAGIAIVFLGWTRYLNYQRDDGKSSGITKRVITFTTLILMLIIISVLSMEDIITGSGAQSLLGAVIGYILADFGN